MRLNRSTPALTGLLAVALVSLPTAADATRPFVTDDARIVDPKAAQLETWFQYHPDSDQQEFWALPAINPTDRVQGGVELTAGVANFWDTEGERRDEIIVQAKTLFRELRPNDVGVGLVVGTALDLDSGNALQDTQEGHFAWIPISVAINDKQTVLHNNIGVSHNRFSNADDQTDFTWGIGIEHWLAPRLQGVAEAFGEGHRESPFYQFGLRAWLVEDRVQVDATYGSQFSGSSEENWVTLGVRLLTPAIL